METIPIEDFGKDHWSMFGYIECLCVDKGGVPDLDKVSCNESRHPGLKGYRCPNWSEDSGTRLRGYFLEDGETDPSRRVKGHDDWDCAYDLEAAGLIEVNGTGIHPVFKMTQKGTKVAGQLRGHKTSGGVFATFVPELD